MLNLGGDNTELFAIIIWNSAVAEIFYRVVINLHIAVI